MAHHPYSTQDLYGDPEQFEEFIVDGYPSQARHGDRHSRTTAAGTRAVDAGRRAS